MCILTSFSRFFTFSHRQPLQPPKCVAKFNLVEFLSVQFYLKALKQIPWISNARLITRLSTGHFSGFFHIVHFFAPEKFGTQLDFVHVTERFLDPS